MTDQNKSNLTDDAIVDIAQSFDQFIMDMGEKHKPSGIEFASIVLGRLIVFSKQVECFESFNKLMTAVTLMFDKGPIANEDDQVH